MQVEIIRPDPTLEYPFEEEGCSILECWNSAGDPQVSVARARVPPGTGTRWHALTGIAERYVILSGGGMVEVGELPPTPVAAGDCVVIPPGVRQRITNTGEKDLLFYAICTPRFRPEHYAALD